MRTTAQPLCLKARDARLSLRRFPSIFSRQARALVLAVRFRPQSCPCQKQPSTNTATFIRGHAKSGRPGRSWCRRQPPILSPRRRNARRFSVVAFPLPRTRDMSSPRRSPPNGVHSDRKILVSTPTADLVAPKEKRETLFGGRVPAAAHP